MGRFINEDTYEGQIHNPLTLNIYAYCTNNPLKYVDPTGHMNYLTQGYSLLRGIYEGFAGNIKNILNISVADIDNLVNILVSGDIPITALIDAGFEDFEKHFNFLVEYSWILDPSKKASNTKVETFGYCLGSVITDIALALSGPAVEKFVSSIARTGKGIELVEAFGITLKSFDDIARYPTLLWGKSADEVAAILGDGWTMGTYGSAGGGWKFTKGDMSIFYHPGGGIHGGSYYGYSSGKLGKNKIVGSDYIPIAGDKATIIYMEE